MSLSLILASLWFLAANVGAILPSGRNHWPLAWCLIAVGIPLLGFVTWQHGPWVGLLVLAGGASILRWPLRHLVDWMKRRAHRP
ncbi:DUF2484 family protein [Oceaniovalibus sp. ACAM 378]|jgi:4-hydroxybenzoate polyprenyltransferase|uniref:DUF2484 family protein n=1 Tax=Oceaniovalibus sp. ACAM 378 TaxID=2599923 RepID=UPI0011DB54F7|nr:DUF2484 family protein [Oceaniovalibus sp. ACAM 378]TYB87991.1 DUF2484 family protein [Oceaniovalibus sp. ACAM 378]